VGKNVDRKRRPQRWPALLVHAAGAKMIDIRREEPGVDGGSSEGGRRKDRDGQIAIPFTAVGPAPKPGMVWRMNPAGHAAENDTWLSAAPTVGAFHDARTFLELVLE
jgi:hypothetical protein